MNRLLLLATLLLAGQALVPTADHPSLDVAERYLAAYAALDFDRLGAFWTDATVWSDPTGAEIGASPEPVRGAQAIRAHLEAATRGVEELELEIDERFRSAGHVVSVGTLRYTLDGAAVGAPGKRVPFELRTVIVLEVQGGRVVRHTDYADFTRWREQLARGLRAEAAGPR